MQFGNFRKSFLSFLAALFCFSSLAFAAETQTTAIQPPFTHGVNLTMWFESWSKTLPNLNMYTEQDFADMKELGIDVVRIPIHFDMFEENDETRKINDIIFEFLDSACDWAEKYNIHLVIDDHSYNSGKYPNGKTVRDHLTKVWPQIVTRYRNRSDLILFEILNEPQLAQNEWIAIQKDIVALIRSMDTKHTVVVTGADWGGLDALAKMQPYEFDNLLYTFHYYDPFIFTHQGASWSGKEMAALKDVPFPYDSKRLPKVTGAAKGTWVENSLRGDYQTKGTEAGMRKQLQKAVNFSRKYNVPVWVGEMGVYNLNAPYNDRVEWYKTTGKLFQEMKLAFTVWGYGTSFGIFKKDSQEIYPYDLDEQIIRGLGFNVPAHIGEPLPASYTETSFPLSLFSDAISRRSNIDAWGSGANYIFSLMDRENPPQGRFNICWGNVAQYNSMNIKLSNFDFSSVEAEIGERVLSLYVKFENASQEVQIRFVDNEPSDGSKKPWRNAYDLKASEIGVGEWILVEIPFTKLKVTGAWSGITKNWYGPSATEAFEWNRVENLQFTAESKALEGVVRFDDIQIK